MDLLFYYLPGKLSFFFITNLRSQIYDSYKSYLLCLHDHDILVDIGFPGQGYLRNEHADFPRVN